MVKATNNVEEELGKLRRTLLIIAHELGVISNAEFREAMKEAIKEVLG